MDFLTSTPLSTSSGSCVTLLTGGFDIVRSICFHAAYNAAEKGGCLLLAQRAEVENHFFSTHSRCVHAQQSSSGSGRWDPEALRRVSIKYPDTLRELCECLALLQTLPTVPDFICIPNLDGLLPGGAAADFGAQTAVLHATACIVDTMDYIAENHHPVSVLVSSSNTSFDHFFQCLIKVDHSYVRVTAEPQPDGSIFCTSTDGQRKAQILRQEDNTWEYT